MMRDKIASLKESIENYRVLDSSKRNSLAEELQYLHTQLGKSRLVFNENLYSPIMVDNSVNYIQ